MGIDREQTNGFGIDIDVLSSGRGISKEICLQCIIKAFLNTLLKKYPDAKEDEFEINYNVNTSMMSVKRLRHIGEAKKKKQE